MYINIATLFLFLCGRALVPARAQGCSNNETLSICATPCPATCSEPNKTCQFLVCNTGCVCKSGFIRESTNGPCIANKDCTNCNPNEVWKKCSDNACKKTCENRNTTIECPKICISGCSCAPGYVWNDNLTICISEVSCPKDCDCNQEWKQCSDNLCKKTCANKDLNEPCLHDCIPGCSCKPGYVWNENLTECILACECPLECGPNQVWEECSDNACRKTCRNRNGPEHCPLCSPGCSCEDGFLWNDDYSACIPIDNCPPQCGSNQVWENCSDNPCKRTCENRNKMIECRLICEAGCSCRDGFVWNKNSTECIPIDSCPIGCGTNQVYKDCSDVHCKKTCATKNSTLPCPPVCTPGCSCEKNYVWNNNLTECISVDICPKVCGPHQVWEEYSDNACKKTCENRNISIPCPEIRVPGCSCVSGYVWNVEQTSCISEDSCPKQCDNNQVYEQCSDNLCKKTCANKDLNESCWQVCIPGCSCKSDYVWNENLTECILACKCPIECGLNQLWEECSDNACRKTCQNRNGPEHCPLCQPGCSCKDGFLWNEDYSACISIDKCPPQCGTNQVWQNCSDNACKRTCENRNKVLPRSFVCLPGCSCKDGFVWNKNLTECIPIDSCPIGCGTNQIYEECSDNNCKRTCATKNATLPCSTVCTPGCSCEENYVWNNNFTDCVPVDSCPKVCGPYQIWEECSDNACKKTCENRNISIPCLKICIPGCSCIPGYVWNSEQTRCISEDSCPNQCGDNQEWEKCSDNLCKKTCANKDLNISCSHVCIEGCSCKRGYIWTENLTECIPECDCPIMCNHNQNWEKCSDSNCRKTCQHRNGPANCPPCIPGCSCKRGFVWKEDYSECIPIPKCPPQCGANQVWEQCSDNPCKRTCDNKDKIFPYYLVCQPGCSCRDGFLWNSNLTECIPVDTCPKECGPNQVFEQCSDNACKKTCDNKDHHFMCPPICLEGCSCIEGYVWNEDLTCCIPIDSCPKVCGPNQHWEVCSDVNCKKTCKNLNDDNWVCNRACIPGCSCNPGYVWNEAETKCILQCECQKYDCGDRGEWSECAEYESRPTCQRKEKRPCHNCVPGCVCKTGYIWDENLKQCVFPHECTRVCRQNEVFEVCSDINCRTTCKNMNFTTPPKCDKKCVQGCSCASGFVWNERSKQCVTPNNCPPVCEEDEVWSPCTSLCDDTCQGPRVYICPTDCIPGCKCKDGYLFDKYRNKCVSISKCTKRCDGRKKWCRYAPRRPVTCQNVLHPQCCKNNVFDVNDFPGCICETGTLLDEYSNKCVSLHSCLHLLDKK